MLRKIYIACIPFGMLLLYTAISCVLGYGIFIWLDGAIELRRLISRLTQVLLIVSIYPVMRYLNIRAAELGFVPIKLFLKQMLGGIVLGLCTLLPVLLLSYSLDITQLNSQHHWTLESFSLRLGIAFLLALLISFLEEPLFRGILISAYIKRIGVMVTVCLSSFYYAILHFIKTRTTVSIENVQFSDSFILALEAFQNLFQIENLGAFWALLMVGIFLAVMRTRLHLSLAWCIGCHAAWVMQIKMAHQLVTINIESNLLYLVSPYDGVIGPLVAIWLSIVIVGYFGYEYGFKKQS